MIRRIKALFTRRPEQTLIPAPVIGNDFEEVDEVDHRVADDFLWSPVVGRDPEWDERFPKKPLIALETPVHVTESGRVAPVDEIVYKGNEILFNPDVHNAVEYTEAWRNASVATLRGTDEIPTNVTEIRIGPSLQTQVEELRTMLRKVSKRMARLSL